MHDHGRIAGSQGAESRSHPSDIRVCAGGLWNKDVEHGRQVLRVYLHNGEHDVVRSML
jgi:hypothetical protein